MTSLNNSWKAHAKKWLIAVGMTISATNIAWADYPNRPITLIVPFAPGGSSDIIARTIAPEMSKKLGQSIVVENYPGAGGVLGMQRAVRATADGYSLLLGSGSEVLINKLINPALPFDGQQDLTPVAFVATGPMVLIGKTSLPPSNIAELVAYAKDDKNQLNFASAGNGTPMHVAGELFNISAGTAITHVPYKGASPALIDVMGGQVELGVATLSAAQAFIKDGKIKAYGTTSREQSSLAPNIPPIGQSPGLEAVDLGVWFGLFVPTKTDDEIVKKLESASQAVLSDPEIIQKLAEQGVTVSGQSGNELKQFLSDEVEKYRAVMKAANIKPQ